MERPLRSELAQLLLTLPRQQRLVSLALVGGTAARTYGEVAEATGLHRGTVHTHLRRIRLRRPETYAVLMAEREQQLAARHETALARAVAHSQEWHRKQANRRFYYRFGYWPWERRTRRLGRGREEPHALSITP